MQAWLTPLLAHQGGWDEIAMVGGPLLLLWLVLLVANRRAKRMAESEDEGA